MAESMDLESSIEAGLKNVQGKSIVNSNSLKEGEAEFLKAARECGLELAPIGQLVERQRHAVEVL